MLCGRGPCLINVRVVVANTERDRDGDGDGGGGGERAGERTSLT